jgi:glyoxylase I family protein
VSLTTDRPSTAPARPSLQGFHHIGLTVTDIARSEAWYGGVFGFQRVMVERHNEGTGSAVVMNRPGTPLFIGLDDHHTNEGELFAEHRTGLDHLALSVEHREDLDRWAAYLDELRIGHSHVNDVTDPFAYATLVVRDPDNIQLELVWMA